MSTESLFINRESRSGKVVMNKGTSFALLVGGIIATLAGLAGLSFKPRSAKE